MFQKKMMLRSTLVALLFMVVTHTFAQGWTFVKEKDGISLYTRKETGNVLKSFKGVMDIHSTIEKVAALIRDVNDNDWWDENLSEIRVLRNDDPLHYQYYMVYDLSWPLSDRDLVVDARVTNDPVAKKYEIRSRALPAAIPEKEGLVRIRNYWQLWTVQALDKGIVRITLEGFADPSGDIPNWLYNSIITNTPLKMLQRLRQRTGL